MKQSRRNWLKRLTAGLMTVVTLPGVDQKDIPISDADRKRQKDRERMKQAERENERQVEELYSTKPIRFRMGKHEYVVPVNYFTPKGRDNIDTGDSQGFGFFLFLPDYGGYTKENWRDPFDPRLIEVVQVHLVEKNAIGVFTDGTRRPLSPDRFDPRKNFEGTKWSIENEGTELYGLTVYRNKGGGATPGAVWTGTRSNGEFFFFRTSLAPGEPTRPGITNPHCDVRYYSEKEDLQIVYRYSQRHIAKWREIDDAIWTKLHGWRVKKVSNDPYHYGAVTAECA